MPAYVIESIDLFIRPLPPDRFDFSIGKQTGPDGKPKPPRRPAAAGLCRMEMRDTRTGKTATGCSGDRPSHGWLDKRPDISAADKLRALIALLHEARDLWLAAPEFDSVFDHWLDRHEAIVKRGQELGHEALSASYASAFFERAVIDAACRLEEKSVFQMFQEDRLGFRPEKVHPELEGMDFPTLMPAQPRTRFFIRHTVGLSDPLTAADLPERINDGEPETLQEYIARDGLRYFKVKISGQKEADIERLIKIWDVVPQEMEPAITLDGNEAYQDLGEFATFVEALDEKAPGLFQHLLYIEQPLTRALTLNPASKPWIERISEKKPLIIDEADGSLDAFKQAHALGYSGTSHKNCKGVFKSLMNLALCFRFENEGRLAFLSGEDLSNLPIVPLHQDFAALGILGLEHCERNGHHYAYGASHLTEGEKVRLAAYHPDLYTKRNGEVFLNIQDGEVECASLQTIGFGVRDHPDWSALEPMKTWLDTHYPPEPPV